MTTARPGKGRAGEAGERLRKAISDAYELQPGEEELLSQASSIVDTLARIRGELEGLEPSELTVTGGNGQLIEHPLLSSQRRHSETLCRLLDTMQLPNADDQAETMRTRKARAAAEARWKKSAS